MQILMVEIVDVYILSIICIGILDVVFDNTYVCKVSYASDIHS